MEITAKTQKLFWAKVDKTDDCWLWTGGTQSEGYGSFGINKKTYLAHRLAYMWLVDDIPAGLVIDHICREHRCVRPDHLEAVTQRENILRGVGQTAKNAAQTHCPSGHSYSGENLYVKPTGGRICRTCRAAAAMRRRARVKVALAA